jgi:hypothetical protein
MASDGVATLLVTPMSVVGQKRFDFGLDRLGEKRRGAAAKDSGQRSAKLSRWMLEGNHGILRCGKVIPAAECG